jgi:SagB-type dehydrogenase family enzyme
MGEGGLAMRVRLVCSSLLLMVALTASCGPSEGGKDAVYQEDVTIQLPAPALDGKVSVEKAIQQRRSVRSFVDTPLTFAQVSQLLWAAQGITDKATGFRAAPSAGALFPMEVYLVAGRVTGLEPGVYHYRPRGHALERLVKGDFRAALCGGALDQSAIREAAVSIVVTGIYERTAGKYGGRAQRYVHMEAGHVGQNVCLQAVALGLGAVGIGGYEDASVRKAILLPDEEVPLYIIPVGHKK